MITSVIYQNTLTIVLAAGQGRRLYPLTEHRAKPSVPFGGKYRVIDFALSNCINSGLRKIYLTVQYRSQSLDQHLNQGWRSLFASELDEFLYTLPPQFKSSAYWYSGSADGVYQNLNILDDHFPSYVLVLSGDHIYKMDYSKLLAHHIMQGADLTLSTYAIPRSEASHFGVLQTDEDGWVTGFDEKPADPQPAPGTPDQCLINMGVYVFGREALRDAVTRDAADPDSEHDFGYNVIPRMIQDGLKVSAYRFSDVDGNEAPYWRDIGTIEAYYEANMDLIAVTPPFNLYDRRWPIRSYMIPYPPAKTVHHETWDGGRIGQAINSMVSQGCIISGAHVEHSVLGPGVHVHSYSHISDAILMDDVSVGRGATIKRAIIDKHVKIPDGYQIGVDLAGDRRKFHVTDSGIVVVRRSTKLD